MKLILGAYAIDAWNGAMKLMGGAIKRMGGRAMKLIGGGL